MVKIKKNWVLAQDIITNENGQKMAVFQGEKGMGSAVFTEQRYVDCWVCMGTRTATRYHQYYAHFHESTDGKIKAKFNLFPTHETEYIIEAYIAKLEASLQSGYRLVANGNTAFKFRIAGDQLEKFGKTKEGIDKCFFNALVKSLCTNENDLAEPAPRRKDDDVFGGSWPSYRKVTDHGYWLQYFERLYPEELLEIIRRGRAMQPEDGTGNYNKSLTFKSRAYKVREGCNYSSWATEARETFCQGSVLTKMWSWLPAAVGTVKDILSLGVQTEYSLMSSCHKEEYTFTLNVDQQIKCSGEAASLGTYSSFDDKVLEKISYDGEYNRFRFHLTSDSCCNVPDRWVELTAKGAAVLYTLRNLDLDKNTGTEAALLALSVSQSDRRRMLQRPIDRLMSAIERTD